MARYLVVHTPRPEEETAVHPPTRMLDLARDHGQPGSQPRWLKAWSPDLHDDRVFTLWEASNAAEIRAVLEHYAFLVENDAHVVRVQEWGPDDVLASEIGGDADEPDMP